MAHLILIQLVMSEFKFNLVRTGSIHFLARYRNKIKKILNFFFTIPSCAHHERINLLHEESEKNFQLMVYEQLTNIKSVVSL